MNLVQILSITTSVDSAGVMKYKFQNEQLMREILPVITFNFLRLEIKDILYRSFINIVYFVCKFQNCLENFRDFKNLLRIGFLLHRKRLFSLQLKTVTKFKFFNKVISKSSHLIRFQET